MSELRNATRRVVLREHEESVPLRLSPSEREALPVVHPGLQVRAHGSGLYVLRPDQRVGVVHLSELVLEIQPKIPMPSALYLLSHAMEAVDWQRRTPDFAEDAGFTDLVAAMLARLVSAATHRGLLHGYRSEVEAAQAPRGRILFDEFVLRRFGLAPPIDIEHDLYTPDILENRILLAALQAVRSVGVRTQATRSEITEAQYALGGVRLMHFPRHMIPDEVPISPLNSHYHAALTLALLVLKGTYIRLGGGSARGTAFLVDMNVVFERFVRNALRRALHLDRRSFPDRAPNLYLDRGSRVSLVPDLTYVVGGKVVWVGDAKYKILPDNKRIAADLYQLHTYCTALELSEGLLVYGTGGKPIRHEHVTVGVGNTLHVHELNVNTSPMEIDWQIGQLARRVGEVRSS